MRELKVFLILCVPIPQVEIAASDAAYFRFPQKVRGESRFCVP